MTVYTELPRASRKVLQGTTKSLAELKSEFHRIQVARSIHKMQYSIPFLFSLKSLKRTVFKKKKSILRLLWCSVDRTQYPHTKPDCTAY